MKSMQIRRKKIHVALVWDSDENKLIFFEDPACERGSKC